MKESSQLAARAIQFAILASLMGAWFIIGRTGAISPLFVPPMEAVWRAFIGLVQTNQFWAAVGTTLMTISRAYGIALVAPQSIFDIATQYAFAGYAALSPLLVAALFWRGSTRWGALAATVWTAAAVLAVAALQTTVPAPPPGAVVSILSVAGVDVIARAASGTLVLGLLPVVPMTLVSALLMVVVSRFTPSSRPGATTLARYF
jgi:Na+/proline symporter